MKVFQVYVSVLVITWEIQQFPPEILKRLSFSGGTAMSLHWNTSAGAKCTLWLTFQESVNSNYASHGEFWCKCRIRWCFNLKIAQSLIRWSSLKITVASSRALITRTHFEAWEKAKAKLILCLSLQQSTLTHPCVLVLPFYSKTFLHGLNLGHISFNHHYITDFKALRPHLNLNCHDELQRLCLILMTAEKWITKWSLLPLSTPGGDAWAPQCIKTELTWKHKHRQENRHTHSFSNSS